MALERASFVSEKKVTPKKINIREELLKYLKKWYLFLLSFLFFGALAYVYVRYTVPQYNVSATIFISQEDNISDSALGAFQDLGVMNQVKDEISSEIQIIRSKTLIQNVVKKLKLNIQYFSKGRILETENYPKSIVEINFLAADSIIDTKSSIFNVLINSETSFSFLDEEGVVKTTHSFGKKVSTTVGNVIITPSTKDIKKNIGQTIKVKIHPVKNIVESYRKRLAVYELSKGTSVVKVSLNDASKEKAKDIINELIDEYRVATIEHKKEISDKTASFIKERINLINKDLTSVDDEAAGYKSKFGLTNDLSAQTQRVAEFDSQSVQAIERNRTQLRLIESMRSFIQSQEGMFDPIPSNLGFEDPSISSTVSRYNGLILQRKRLLKTSSTQNPVVVNVDEQINGLRQVLLGGLNSLKSSVDIKLSSLETQEKYFSGKLYVAPTRQKDLRVIEREQTIKEQLYLYLLQKREEAEITSHITVPNSRIIDRASALGSSPVSPNKKVIYAGSMFLGFLLPFMFLYLKDLLNTKVRSKDDLEEALSIPMLGAIPENKKKNKIIIDEKSRTPISEAFRILRTNLDFVLTGVKKESGKVIFVTSSISGEGKTFISSNLAKTLAIYGSKVAYVGSDFRYPKFHKFLDLPKGKKTPGFTNFIMNSELKPQDIIYKEKSENPIDIIPSGDIPPNPSGLLVQPRVKEMFDYLEQNYDYIIVDTAPVTLVTDTMLISKQADLTIYVVREGYTDKRILTFPETYFEQKRLQNLAIVLNSAKLSVENNYGY
ncbi:GumC family protein [Aquimarina agarilytica]|uniref:GumC family protein n=1 Tax=Aquimarina agarilytica TaxID=1087449 RepID=UPI000288B6ED|nr:polysaccharide biosynthesis tyrosine autokinase [Aquimarina agarilytica]